MTHISFHSANCKNQMNLKKYSKQKSSFADSWSVIKASKILLKIDYEIADISNESEDEFFEDKPFYQEILTDVVNISTKIIEYSKYEQIDFNQINCHNLDECFHGILSYIYIYSNNKYNTNELEIYYSGSKYRKNVNYQKDQYDILNIFQYENIEKEFIIGNFKNAHFGINFKRIKINPISYVIQSGYSSYNNLCLISFKFEGYDEELNRWDVLDERENSNNLIREGAYMMYFTKHTNKSYSIFRIVQTSPNQNNVWGFSISAVDIHGNISNRTDLHEKFILNETEVEAENENEHENLNEFSYEPFLNTSDIILV